MKEQEVQERFVSWLERRGWSVQTSAREADIVANRGDVELRVEVKGDTSEPGTDADTAYGQLLRRMVSDSRVRYAIVGSARSVNALRRLPAFVRWRLGIALYEVTETEEVVEHDRPPHTTSPIPRSA